MYNTEQLMKELDYFYEPIRHIYSKEEWFVYLKNSKWQVLKDSNVVLETNSYLDVLAFLIDKKCDLSQFDNMMAGCIKTKYVYMKNKIEKIKLIFNEEELAEAEEDMKAFQKGIIMAIKKQLSGFKVVDGGKCE